MNVLLLLVGVVGDWMLKGGVLVLIGVMMVFDVVVSVWFKMFVVWIVMLMLVDGIICVGGMLFELVSNIKVVDVMFDYYLFFGIGCVDIVVLGIVFVKDVL